MKHNHCRGNQVVAGEIVLEASPIFLRKGESLEMGGGGVKIGFEIAPPPSGGNERHTAGKDG